MRCLHTSNRGRAERLSLELSSRLENIWDRLRLDLVTFNQIIEPRVQTGGKISHAPKQASAEGPRVPMMPTIEDALDLYIRLKAPGKGELFEAHARRNIASFTAAVGVIALNDMRKSNGGQFRDYLLAQGLSSSSITRVFSSVKAIINLALREWDIDATNPLVGTYIPEVGKSKKRVPFCEAEIKVIQSECRDLNDDKRWLIALISDTGMRLAEAAGTSIDDIRLEDSVPHIVVRNHPWRRLKTSSSNRVIPLVGASLWAAKCIVANASNDVAFAFPRYTSPTATNANSASAALNKWVKARVTSGAVIHSFRLRQAKFNGPNWLLTVKHS